VIVVVRISGGEKALPRTDFPGEESCLSRFAAIIPVFT